MGQGQARRLRAGARAGLSRCDLVRRTARLTTAATLLEVFSGWSELSVQAAQRPGWRSLQPFELLYGDDLLTREGQADLWRVLEAEDPDLEPPCGPWSTLQNWNDPDVVAAKREQHMGFWRLARKIWDHRHGRGKLVLIENPARSAAWDLPCMKGCPGQHEAIVSQCMDGLRDPVSHRLYRKETRLLVNDPVFAELLARRGRCCHRPDQHEPIQGSVRWKGRTVLRSALAARWPTRLAKRILHAADQALRGPADVAVALPDLAEEVSLEGLPAFAADASSPGPAPREVPVEQSLRDEFARLQREEDARRGDVRAGAARVDSKKGPWGHTYFKDSKNNGPWGHKRFQDSKQPWALGPTEL